MQDADYCKRLVREADRDRYLASLFAPAPYRPALHALYAFNIEITRVREAVREPFAGEVRLQWWRDFLAGLDRGEVRANPVAAALSDAIAQYRLPVLPLVELVDARFFDLSGAAVATFAELETYAARTSSALVALAAHILADGKPPPMRELAAHAGIAYAIAALLHAFPVHAARGKLYLPADVMARHGARAEDLLAGKVSDELRAALAELRLRARTHLTAAGKAIDQMPDAMVPALLPVASVGTLLKRMERANYDPYKPPDIAPWRRQWLMWRAARRPGRIFA